MNDDYYGLWWWCKNKGNWLDEKIHPQFDEFQVEGSTIFWLITILMKGGNLSKLSIFGVWFDIYGDEKVQH
jgi:hypothetical protein